MSAAVESMTYTPAPTMEHPQEQTQQQPHEHPTVELPTLQLEQLEEQQAAPPEKSLLATIANQLVTVLLAIAVVGVLAVNVGPLVLPYRVYTVLSGSMQPTIPIGSEVVLRPAPAQDIHVGDVITFQRPGNKSQLVTHRIVSTVKTADGGTAWITKGDANAVSDAWQIPATGTGLKYAFHVPYLGYAFAMLGSPLGRICFILAPALLLAAVVLNDVWKPEQPKQPQPPNAEPRRKQD